MKQEPRDYKIDFDELPRKPRQPQSIHKPINNRVNIKEIYSQKSYFSLIIVGIIIIIIGIIIRVVVHYYFVFGVNPDVSQIIYGTGEIIRLLGLMLLFIGLIYGSLKDESLHPHVRLGMLIAVGLIFGFIGYSSIYV